MTVAGDGIDVALLDDAWLNDRSEFQLNWVHGLRNPSGLHLQYSLERDAAAGTHRVVTEWTASDEHVGFPGFVHGGLLSAVLDDAMGRATALLKRWVVTGRLEVRYRAGAPTGVPLHCEGWMTRVTSRLVTSEGRIVLPSGDVAAEATGTYMPLNAELRRDMLGAWPGFAEYIDGAADD